MTYGIRTETKEKLFLLLNGWIYAAKFLKQNFRGVFPKKKAENRLFSFNFLNIKNSKHVIESQQTQLS